MGTAAQSAESGVSAVTSVITGWRVVRYEPNKRGGERAISLSRVYQVKQSAEQFAALVRANGTSCEVVARRGIDDLGTL
jgi:hypothetical protein